MKVGDLFEPDKLKGACDKVDNIQCDYLIIGKAKKYAIERKTWTDLLGSIKDGRLFDQLQRLKNLQSTDGFEPRLIIEGYKFMLFKYKKINKAQLEGLLTAVIDFGVPILYAETQDATIMQLNLLDKRAGDTEEYIRPTIAKVNRDSKTEKEDILCAIDGIGRVSAKKLLRHFGTVKNAINADELSLCRVIGVREARHLQSTYTEQYED